MPLHACLPMLDFDCKDFDYYKFMKAFAAQVLCTLKAWESRDYCRERPGFDEPLGSIRSCQTQYQGSSVCVGSSLCGDRCAHLATLAKDHGGKRTASVD